REHDNREHELEQGCRTYCAAIIENPIFVETFRSVTAEAASEPGLESAIIPSESDFMGFLAECLVNNIESLSSYYKSAEFWNRYRGRFLQVLSVPELAPLRESTAQLGQAM